MEDTKLIRYAPYVSISIFIFVVVLVLLSFESIEFPKPETREIMDEPTLHENLNNIQENIGMDFSMHHTTFEQPKGPFLTSSIDLGNETEVFFKYF